MSDNYYYIIQGYTCRMMVARGLEVEYNAANAYFLDIEKDDYHGKHTAIREKGLSEEHHANLESEEEAKFESGLEYFKSHYPSGSIILTGKNYKGDEILFIILRNYEFSFVKDTYTKLANELKKDIEKPMCIITYSLPSKTFIKGLGDKRKTFMEHQYLMYDPTLHIDTPKHILLTDEMKKRYLEDTNINPDNMIKIPRSDVISRWFGASAGQIFKVITKKDYNTPFTITYCIVSRD